MRLSQAVLLVQPYPDYIRVGLNLPPDTTVTGHLRIRAPAGMSMYIGNQAGAVRLTGVHSRIQANAAKVLLKKPLNYPETSL